MSVETDLLSENIKKLQEILIIERKLLANKNIEIKVIEEFYHQLVNHLVVVSKNHLNDFNLECNANTVSEIKLKKMGLQNYNDNQFFCPTCGKSLYQN